MLIKILITGVVLLALFLIFVSTRPSTFRYERSLLIKSTPETLFPYINNQKLGDSWSPWNEGDPDMKKTYEGPEAGVGSSLAWDGNKQVGAGKSTIIESQPNSLVRMKLEFFRPFKAVNTAEFSLVPEGSGTRVTWSMYGPAPFMAKLMGVFINCDKMCGDQFSKGLNNLKSLVENKN